MPHGLGAASLKGWSSKGIVLQILEGGSIGSPSAVQPQGIASAHEDRMPESGTLWTREACGSYLYLGCVLDQASTIKLVMIQVGGHRRRACA